MQALHYYIKNQSRQLRTEIKHISALLNTLKSEKDSLGNDKYNKIKQELDDFNLRKKIELLNFNKQLIKKRFVLNEEAEKERIQNDIAKLNYLRLEWSTNDLDALIQSLVEHKTHFTPDGIGTQVFNVAKKAIGFTGESWEAARGSVAASSQILGQLSPAISGVFDSFTLVGETIVNFVSGKEAAEKYEIGTQLHQAVKKHQDKENDKIIKLNKIKSKYDLSDEKINKYKTADEAKLDLLKRKDDLQLNRSVTGITNGTLGIIGTAGCWTTIGIGITSLLQYLGVIAIPASTLGALSLAATGLSVVGPFALASIFANKFRQNRIEYAVQKEVTKSAKYDFKNLRDEVYPEKNNYKELKNEYETSLSDKNKTSNGGEANTKFLEVYEKENIYKKEKQKLKSINVEKTFSAIELGASLFAVTGSLLLALSGFASFGIAPTVILVTGSAVALAAVTFEYIDKKNGYKYSDYLSNKWKEFKNWVTPDALKSEKKKTPDKTNQKTELKTKLKNTAVSLLPDINNISDLNHLDTVYDQLQEKEQKLFRQAAWEKIETMKFSTPDKELDFLMEARKHSVFNKHRGFGLFSRTSTVEKIDDSIAKITHEIHERKSQEDRIKEENQILRQQYLYRPHR